MLSRNGIATISHYLCFKTGYTEDELKKTGLKQVVDEEKLEQEQLKDPYANVKTRVFSNATPVANEGDYP